MYMCLHIQRDIHCIYTMWHPFIAIAIVLLRTNKIGYQTNLHPADQAMTKTMFSILFFFGRSGSKFLSHRPIGKQILVPSKGVKCETVSPRGVDVIYVYIHTHISIHIYTYMYKSFLPHAHSVQSGPRRIYIYIYIHTYMHVHVHMHIYATPAPPPPPIRRHPPVACRTPPRRLRGRLRRCGGGCGGGGCGGTCRPGGRE